MLCSTNNKVQYMSLLSIFETLSISQYLFLINYSQIHMVEIVGV